MTATDPGGAFVVPAVTARQRSSIRRWQGTDRFYEQVQRIARGGVGRDDAAEVALDLAALIEQSRTRRRVVVWRGVRSLARVVGGSGVLTDMEPEQSVRLEGFTAASLDRAVAEYEFVSPPGGGGAALLRLDLPPGTRALWLGDVGRRALRYQQEVLMLDPVVRWQAVDRQDLIPVVHAKVVS